MIGVLETGAIVVGVAALAIGSTPILLGFGAKGVVAGSWAAAT